MKYGSLGWLVAVTVSEHLKSAAALVCSAQQNVSGDVNEDDVSTILTHALEYWNLDLVRFSDKFELNTAAVHCIEKGHLRLARVSPDTQREMLQWIEKDLRFRATEIDRKVTFTSEPLVSQV